MVLLLIQPFPVLHDYPEWMYQGHIVWSLLSDALAGPGNTSASYSTYAGYYEVVPVPVPNAITQVGVALLNMLVTPVWAGKIWLGVYILLALVTAFISFRGHRISGAKQFIFLLTIAFGTGFFNGYLNFQFGVILFTLFVATGSRRSIAWLFIFSLLIYFSHASVFAGFVIYVVISEIFNQRRVTAFFALLPSLLMLLWYTAVKIQTDGEFNAGVGSAMRWVQYKIYTLAKQGPFHNFILPDGQSLLADLHVVYLVGFAINFLVAILIGSWLLSIGWNYLQRTKNNSHGDAGSHALIATVAILLVLWLLSGTNTLGVVNLGERFLIVALILLLLQLEMPPPQAYIWTLVCFLSASVTVLSLLTLSRSTEIYSVDRSADSAEVTSFVDNIYSNSRHKHFNHRIFIYANLGQYLLQPDEFESPPPVDHESSIVRMLKSQ